MEKGLSIILPAFNEELNIALAVRDILNFTNSIDLNSEIIIVNDGSFDRTGEIADNLASTNPNIQVIHHQQNLGYGQALNSGITASRYELLFFTDADRQFDIKSLEEMLLIMKTVDNLDILVGYRLHRQDPFWRKFLSWGFNTIAGFLFNLNIKDIDCAFKLFRKKIFSYIEIESKYFFVNTEILAKAKYLGFKIAEIGVPHLPRMMGKSTISLRYVPLTLRELWRIWGNLRRLKKEPSIKDEGAVS